MEFNSKLLVLGMMSGTSMDGLDCIIVEIQIKCYDKLKFKIFEKKSFNIPSKLRNEISKIVDNPQMNFLSLHKKLGNFYTSCASQLNNHSQLDLISYHGQTIFHKERIKSIQIGDSLPLRNHFNIPILYNFREADIKVGGTGAPLMPFLDWLIFKNSKYNDITLNIGGISNITYIPKNGIKNQVIGFDTGPGMSLIDECCLYFWNIPFDIDGLKSKKGKVNQKILKDLMKHPFIDLNFPKSTGRDIFGKNLTHEIIKMNTDENPYNILRTFVAFTAKSISKNLYKIRNFSPLENRLFISGGGVHHSVLIDDIKLYSGIKRLHDLNDVGINPKYKEALLMAVLGYTRFNNISNNMPSVTGAKNETILGDIIINRNKKYEKNTEIN